MTKKLQPYLQLAKYLWIALIFVGAVVYLARNLETIKTSLAQLDTVRLLVSCGLLAAGRLVLILPASEAIDATSGIRVSYRQMYPVETLTQLAKYLPGGIWHFVGKSGYYRGWGFSASQITRSILIENLWMVSGVALVGIGMVTLALIPSVQAAVVIAGVAIVWACSLYLLGRWYGEQTMARRVPKVIIVQTTCWVLIGLSWGVLLPGQHPVTFSAGVFCLSWVIGFVSIFAPGGIGVRESLLVVLLFDPETQALGIVLATTHRFLWTLLEVLLALLALTVFRNQSLTLPNRPTLPEA